MQNISFCGLLNINDSKNPQIINTDHIVRISENKEKGKTQMTLSVGEPVYFSYPYAEMQQAFIKAHKSGYYDYTPGKNTEENAPVANNETPKGPVSPKGNNLFALLPDGLKNKHGSNICPNSLEDINRYLRNDQQEKLTDYDKTIIKAVDKAFDEIDGLEEDTALYRALSADSLDEKILNAKAGDTIVPDAGYAQTKYSENDIGQYLPGESYNPVIFEIRCKKGTKICKVPGRLTGSGYEEAMMPRGAKLKVLSKEKTDFTYYYPAWGGGVASKTTPVLKYTFEYVED